MPQTIQRHRRATLHWSTRLQREQDETEKSYYGVGCRQKGIWFGPANWIIKCLKVYKLSDEVIQLSKKKKHVNLELTAGGKNLGEVMIQRGIFQRYALSPLLFVIAMMPLNHILRKCTGGYKLSKSQEKINHLMYMDDIKMFAKNEK